MTATIETTQPTSTDLAPSPARRALDGRWPLAGVVAAGTGIAFSLFSSRYLDEAVTGRGPSAVYDAIAGDGTRAHPVIRAFASRIARPWRTAVPSSSLGGAGSSR